MIQEYSNYLQLEQGLSPNSREAYLHDVRMLQDFLGPDYDLRDATLGMLSRFVQELGMTGLSATSQARVISGVRGFYHFLFYTVYK